MTDTSQYEYLLEKENVEAVGFNDEGTLVVYVSKKVPESELPTDAIISNHATGDMESDVREADEIWMQGVSQGTPRTRHRPVRGGLSEGPANQRMAGTGGGLARVTDPDNEHLASSVTAGDLVRVSNCHVYADARSRGGQYGDPITQPGRLDGGNDDTVLAPLVGYVPINGEMRVDAAIRAASTHDRQGFHGIESGSADLPTGVRREYSGMSGTVATKSGRTTGVTTADVETVNATVRVRVTENRSEVFRDQIITGPLSSAGDSGSSVLDEDGQLFGHLFAGSDRVTILNKIANVEEALGIEMHVGPIQEEEEEEEGPDAPVDEPDLDEPAEPYSLGISPARIGTLEYSFAVEDGAAVDFEGRSSTRVGDRINAWSAGWTNRYDITGPITDVSIPDGSHVTVNGEQVNVADLIEHTQTLSETSEP